MSRAFVKDDDEDRPEPRPQQREHEAPPPPQSRDLVGYGATVTVRSADGETHVYTIVDEDNDDPVRGRIAWTSPLAEALLDRASGETVTWHRPVGDAKLRIERIDYHGNS